MLTFSPYRFGWKVVRTYKGEQIEISSIILSIDTDEYVLTHNVFCMRLTLVELKQLVTKVERLTMLRTRKKKKLN